jgi:DNA transposition AAA+ family ATPase
MGGNDELMNSIIEVLNKSGRMIVVDEAQFLTTICLEILRQIYDEAGIGVVYSGMPELRDRIVGHGAVKLEQIYSRISFAAQLPPLDEQDVRLILEATGIKIDSGATQRLIDLCEGSGRRLMNIFKKAHREAGPSHTITAGMVEKAHRKLIANLRWEYGEMYGQKSGEAGDKVRVEDVLYLNRSKDSAVAS